VPAPVPFEPPEAPPLPGAPPLSVVPPPPPDPALPVDPAPPPHPAAEAANEAKANEKNSTRDATRAQAMSLTPPFYHRPAASWMVAVGRNGTISRSGICVHFSHLRNTHRSFPEPLGLA
jgi:hypothetical protein